MYVRIVFLYVIMLVWRESTVQCQLVYVHGAAFKLVAGFGVPVDINLKGGSLSWFTNLQAIYTLPDNVTYFEPYKVIEKRSVKNTFNRYTVYQALAKYLDRLGITGNECIHRLICEVARTSFDSVIGDVVRILFSPNKDPHVGLNDYRKAHWQGSYNVTDCSIIYPGCHIEENSIFFSEKPSLFFP